MNLDKSHLNEFENISPPMVDALSIPVLGSHGVIIYVCRSPFTAHMPQVAKRTDVKRVAQALTLTDEIIEVIKQEIDDCDHPQCVDDRKRFGFSDCAGGHIARRTVDAINAATKGKK